jgi:hypothetical protein
MKHLIRENKQSQNWLVIHWLVTYGKITSLTAMRAYGIMRLGARIYDLKRKGFNIVSILEFDPNNKSRHWSQYELVKTKKTK